MFMGGRILSGFERRAECKISLLKRDYLERGIILTLTVVKGVGVEKATTKCISFSNSPQVLILFTLDPFFFPQSTKIKILT